MLLRYMSLKYGLEALRTGEFKVTRPCDANDPYEMMGGLHGRLSDRVRGEFCNSVAMGWAREAVNPTNRRIILPLRKVLNDAWNNFEKTLAIKILSRETFDKNESFLCFADADQVTDETDQLMWAHYGECGRGVRIWFDEERLKEVYPLIRPIVYQEQRPTLELDRLTSWGDADELKEFIGECYFTKSQAWAYEHEKRLLIFRSMGEQLKTRRGDIELIRIPIDAITRVDFGPMGMTDEMFAAITEFQAIERMKHIEFRVATFTQNTYSYSYDLVES